MHDNNFSLIQLAIFVIAACGFGLPFSWNEPPTGEDGSMSLQESLRLVSDYNLVRTSAPNWFWKLPISKCVPRDFFRAHTDTDACSRYQYVDKAYKTLDAFMKRQLESRRKEIRQEINETGVGESGRSDVFSRLVLANECDTEKLPLDSQELVRWISFGNLRARAYRVLADWKHIRVALRWSW